jgi:5-methylcytosine-specific restriction endonuclease McrA
LDELIKQRNITNNVKAQRLSWVGHIDRMPETSIVKRRHKRKPFTGRPAGKSKSRWEEDVRNDLKKDEACEVSSTSPGPSKMEG